MLGGRSVMVLVGLSWLAGSNTALAQQVARGGIGLVEAVDLTLRNHPEIRLQGQVVDFNRGRVEEATGQFEARLNGSFDRIRDAQPFTNAQLALARQSASGLSSTVTNLTTYRLGFDKQYQSGLSIAPSVQMTRQDLNVQGPATNRAIATMQVAQPLLRGRGTEVVTAVQRAAQIEVNAATLDLRQTQSTAAARTVLAYWQYVASLKNLDVLRDAEARGEQLVTEMRALIEADSQPAANLKQPLANLADRRAQRLGAEQSVFAARQALGLATGIPYEQIGELPPPADDFPPVPLDPLAGTAPEAFSAEVMAHRTDLQASDRRRTQSQVLRDFARNGLKPQVDVVATVGYAGLDEGTGLWQYLSPLGVSGFNASMGVSYGWPNSRRSALGAALRAEAGERQATIQFSELGRTIRSGIAVAHNLVRQNAERVKSAREATALYRAAIDDERQKLLIGLSTIIDSLLTQDRLTQSLLELVSAERSYAEAVARFRYETGTLLGPALAAPTVDFDTLTTPPSVAPLSR